jgi:hypothetical protein
LVRITALSAGTRLAAGYYMNCRAIDAAIAPA